MSPARIEQCAFDLALTGDDGFATSLGREEAVDAANDLRSGRPLRVAPSQAAPEPAGDIGTLARPVRPGETIEVWQGDAKVRITLVEWHDDLRAELLAANPKDLWVEPKPDSLFLFATFEVTLLEGGPPPRAWSSIPTFPVDRVTGDPVGGGACPYGGAILKRLNAPGQRTLQALVPGEPTRTSWCVQAPRDVLSKIALRLQAAPQPRLQGLRQYYFGGA